MQCTQIKSIQKFGTIKKHKYIILKRYLLDDSSVGASRILASSSNSTDIGMQIWETNLNFRL